jgi:hypothetical protein
MSTSIHPKKKSVHHTASVEITEPEVPATASAGQAEAAPIVPAVFLTPPPSSANIPSPPGSFKVSDVTIYNGVQPRVAETTALPGAVSDLRQFTDYAQTLGATVPMHDDVVQSFHIASLWSEMRTRSSAWDAYCRLQEGIAWTMIRAQMERLLPAFALAVRGNPAIAVRYPNLATLLYAKKAIAQKAAATRAANRKEIADGKAPTHGKVGRKRRRAAANAALAAANAPKDASPAPAPLVGSEKTPLAATESAPSNGASHP